MMGSALPSGGAGAAAPTNPAKACGKKPLWPFGSVYNEEQWYAEPICHCVLPTDHDGLCECSHGTYSGVAGK